MFGVLVFVARRSLLVVCSLLFVGLPCVVYVALLVVCLCDACFCCLCFAGQCVLIVGCCGLLFVV